MANNSAHFICLFVYSLQNICCIHDENNLLYFLVNNYNFCLFDLVDPIAV
jgi:hypothetical protein